MPIEYQLSKYEKSLLELAKEQEKLVGFDGKYSLPDKQRVQLDMFHEGEKAMLLKIFKVLDLSAEKKKELIWNIWSEKNPDSVQEVSKELENLRFLK